MMQKILVIDDDAAVRGAFELVLSEMGCAVRVAEDGLAGIEMARSERPDLIFLDLKMPGIDGVETLRRLLALDTTLSIYIVTAFSQEYLSDLNAAQAQGLKFQLASKPLSSSQIRRIAMAANSVTEVNKNDKRIALTLYVVAMNPEIQQTIDELSSMLASSYRPGCWSLNVVEVLAMPEKALQNDIFATPTLVREIPQPVLKLLGSLSKMPSVLASITTQDDKGSGTVIL